MKLKLVLLGSLVLSTSVFAQGQGQGGEPPSFSDFDANGDSCLTQDELRGPLADDFSKIDANGDSCISEDEMPSGPGGGQGGEQGGPGGGQER